jgi:hypothetical protein
MQEDEAQCWLRGAMQTTGQPVIAESTDSQRPLPMRHSIADAAEVGIDQLDIVHASKCDLGLTRDSAAPRLFLAFLAKEVPALHHLEEGGGDIIDVMGIARSWAAAKGHRVF